MLRNKGIDWPDLHPDSGKLVRWMKQSSIGPYIKEQVYPGGFFFLFKPVQNISLGVLIDPNNTFYDGRLLSQQELNFHLILLARRFNVWLGAITCVLMFILAKQIFKSIPAGLVAAAFLAFFRFHVEHCHYEETDIAQLFTLSIALIAWSGVTALPSKWRFLSASLLSGIAAGTKFPMSIILPFIPAYAITMAKSNTMAKRIALIAFLSMAGLMIFFVGLVITNPALLLDNKWFFARFLKDAHGTIGEKTTVIGEAANLPLAGLAHQSLWLGRFLRAWGWPALIISVTGAWLWFRDQKALRRGLHIWAFTLMYLAYLLLAAPWVRMQETFSLLIFAACSAGGLAKTVFLPETGKLLWPRRTLAAGLIIMALAWGVQQSLWISSLFAWNDTRCMAETWLSKRRPHDATLGFELYTKTMAFPNLSVQKTVGLYKIEKQDQLPRCSFVLRNTTILGRGLINPFTGRLYDKCQERLNSFNAEWAPVCEWSPCPPNGPADFAFVDSRLVLYARRASKDARDFEIQMPRPLSISNDGLTFFKQGHGFGAMDIVQLHRRNARIAAGGSDATIGPVYAVLFSRGEQAQVLIHGFAESRVISLNAWDAAAICLERPKWQPRFKGFEKIHAKIIAPCNDLSSPLCLALTFSKDEALAMLLALGSEKRAMEFISEAGMFIQNSNMLEPANQPHEALQQWKATSIQSAKNALAVPEGQLKINGMAEAHYDAFARLASSPTYETILELDQDATAKNRWRALIETPVILPPGRWNLSCKWRVDGLAGMPSNQLPRLRVETAQGSVLWEENTRLTATNQWIDANCPLTINVVTSLTLQVSSSAPLRIFARELSINWSLRERLKAVFTQH